MVVVELQWEESKEKRVMAKINMTDKDWERFEKEARELNAYELKNAKTETEELRDICLRELKIIEKIEKEKENNVV